MTAREKQAIISALVRESGASLESFFRSHELGAAYRKPSDGWGKEKRVNEALEAATRRGDIDDILRDAVRHFALAGAPQQRSRDISAASADDTPLDLLRLERLHPEIRELAAAYFRDGYMGAAILEALKAVEVRVKTLSGLDDLKGKDLMAQSLRGPEPLLPLNAGGTESERNEQDGFKFIFMGAMVGVRNPKAHDLFAPLEPDRAYEYLAFASLLMRRLDDAEAILRDRGDFT